MKIVLWIGSHSYQRALANKVNADFDVCGIIVESKATHNKITFRKIIDKLIERIFFSALHKSWTNLITYFDKQFSDYPDVPILHVENINCKEAFDFSSNLNPDLILVSGTRIIKEKMLSVQSNIGILNLHTGLSPYVKGGPNCTNWCIATQQFHLIGNTIMWIDAGIDSGNILTTEFTELNGNEDFSQVHIKVMNHAHELYLKAIQYLAKGNKQSFSQSVVGHGKTYYSKNWDLQKKFALIQNFSAFKEYYKLKKQEQERQLVKVFKIQE